MHEGERFYYVTDASLAAMAETLSSTSPPLVALDLSRSEEDRVLRGTVALTDAGRSVLAGQLDRVRTCGIDRWLGGVHLHGRSAAWRWDDANQRVVRDG
jgi:hypothetical protein